MNGSAAAYLSTDLRRVADVQASSSSHITIPDNLVTRRPIGDRAFAVATARVRNSLPQHLCLQTKAQNLGLTIIINQERFHLLDIVK